MKKELLTVEFRYNDKPKYCTECRYVSKTVTIGIFDSLEEAVKVGNDTLRELSKSFEVRDNDVFKIQGLFGFPDRLITNTCYPTKGVQYFAHIESLDFCDLPTTITEAFNSSDRCLNEKQ